MKPLLSAAAAAAAAAAADNALLYCSFQLLFL